MRRIIVTVQVTDDDSNLAQPFGREPGRQCGQCAARGLDERSTQREVFDRVSGQDHLRERDDMRPTVRGVCGEPQHQVGVGLQRPDGRIDLSERETDLWHVLERTAPMTYMRRAGKRPTVAHANRTAGVSGVRSPPRLVLIRAETRT